MASPASVISTRVSVPATGWLVVVSAAGSGSLVRPSRTSNGIGTASTASALAKDQMGTCAAALAGGVAGRWTGVAVGVGVRVGVGEAEVALGLGVVDDAVGSGDETTVLA